MAPAIIERQHENLLIVITGATASGKSAVALEVAQTIGCDIISADSRQLYRDIPIATAAPSADDLEKVNHHFIGTLDLHDYYSAAQYEADVVKLLPELWAKNSVQVLCGGSMMYVDAVTDGIDALPTISEQVRQRVIDLYQSVGLEGLLAMLENLDPEYLRQADIANHRRIMHALEIILQSGEKYSALRKCAKVRRDFDILKVHISWPRPELFSRINKRVEQMIADGLEEEAIRVYSLRHLNALNTVGLKEMFAFFDGTMTRQEAIARIAKNTRVYAKKQLTWLARPTVRPSLPLSPTTVVKEILSFVK